VTGWWTGQGSGRTPPLVIMALSVTQIVGYGTLFYSYAILSPSIAASFGWRQQTAFAVLSAGFLLGGLISPYVGKLSDRHRAATVMAWGSVAAAVGLVCAAFAPTGVWFAIALISMQVAAACVQYSLAFVSIVQLGGRDAARGIVHLTLIAGFASTLFWPLTSWLHGMLDWRTIFLIFAAMNLVICAPLHGWLASFSRRHVARAALPPEAAGEVALPVEAPPPKRRRTVFVLMLLGLSAQAFALTSILIHMVPLTAALGMGAAGIWASTLFGPAQVASRLVNMVFGSTLRQAWLAVISILLLPAGIGLLLATTPWLPGALIFMVMFGFGSGLNSIVTGTLPLELFGRAGYGSTIGWSSGARAVSGALAPFAFSAMQGSLGVEAALAVLALTALAGSGALVAIALITRPE